jgi:Fur family ferric uptake transcriptional regulator
MDSWTDQATRLRAAGLRVTAQRLVLLSLVDADPHADVATLVAAARARLGSLSTQAVYDALETFRNAGLVRRIEPAGSAARYETRVADNHHHIVCRVCGVTADVDYVIGEAPCLEPLETHGFVLDEPEVTFWGICPVCRAERQEGFGDAVEARVESVSGSTTDRG